LTSERGVNLLQAFGHAPALKRFAQADDVLECDERRRGLGQSSACPRVANLTRRNPSTRSLAKFHQDLSIATLGTLFATRVGRDLMMTWTEEMLTLMEVGIGVREAVFVTTGILPLDVAESDRADYERDIETVLRSSHTE
jgi:hypothetical protein